MTHCFLQCITRRRWSVPLGKGNVLYMSVSGKVHAEHFPRVNWALCDCCRTLRLARSCSIICSSTERCHGNAKGEGAEIWQAVLPCIPVTALLRFLILLPCEHEGVHPISRMRNSSSGSIPDVHEMPTYMLVGIIKYYFEFYLYLPSISFKHTSQVIKIELFKRNFRRHLKISFERLEM